MNAKEVIQEHIAVLLKEAEARERVRQGLYGDPPRDVTYTPIVVLWRNVHARINDDAQVGDEFLKECEEFAKSIVGKAESCDYFDYSQGLFTLATYINTLKP